MFETSSKQRLSLTNLHSVPFVTHKKQSKFSVLYNQVFEQVQKKIGIQQQNLPLLRMKSYQQPSPVSSKPKNLHTQVKRETVSSFSNLQQPKSIIPINIRYDSCNKRKSVNKILWEKKMSLQTLRASSSRKKLQQTAFFKQSSKQTLKILRQKTIQQKIDKENQEEYNVLSHMYILPLNLISSREEKQKFLSNKKKIVEKIKRNIGLQKDKKGETKICHSDRNVKPKVWETDRDDDQFINFVNQKNSLNFQCFN